jgi:nitrite reductase/ring-hydroxylating ferredoxin subunit
MIAAKSLCRLDDIGDPGSKGIVTELDGRKTEIFLVRKGDEVFAYRNRCPHTGSPLDWLPDQFLDLDKTYIQCATHAARFRIEDGKCVSGPCHGDSLQPLKVVIDHGEVVLIQP